MDTQSTPTSYGSECHDAGFDVAGRGAGGTGAAVGDGNGHTHIATALTAKAGDLDHAGSEAFGEGRGALPGVKVDDQHILGSQGLGVLILDGQVPDLQLSGIRTVQVTGLEGLGDLRLLQRAVSRAEDVAGDLALPVQFGGAFLHTLAQRAPDLSRGSTGVEVSDKQFSGNRLARRSIERKIVHRMASFLGMKNYLHEVLCVIQSGRQKLKGEFMMAKNERFEKVYSQGKLTVTQIWVDKETGVNYLYHEDGYSGGLTPLLDREGKPVISAIVHSDL